jgi:hypothetical protein
MILPNEAPYQCLSQKRSVQAVVFDYGNVLCLGQPPATMFPKGAEEATREGVAAWQNMQICLRELAESNKERNLQCAREAAS